MGYEKYVYFNHPQARKQLLEAGFCYTLLKERPTGRGVAVEGSVLNHAKIGDVNISLVEKDVTVQVKGASVRTSLDGEFLNVYLAGSGFRTVPEWWGAACSFVPKCVPDAERFNLYRVDLNPMIEHCPILPSHSVNKRGRCSNRENCAHTGNPLCAEYRSHALIGLTSKTGSGFMKKSVKREVVAPKDEQPKTEQNEQPKTETSPEVKPETKAEKAKGRQKKPVTTIPDDQLKDLTEETFLEVLGLCGGSQVTTAQMLPYFKICKDSNPQHRWPKLRQMADKLNKKDPPKVVLVKIGKEYKYDLP